MQWSADRRLRLLAGGHRPTAAATEIQVCRQAVVLNKEIASLGGGTSPAFNSIPQSKERNDEDTENLGGCGRHVGLDGASQAALVNLGDGTVKDDITNLIWLQDWNVNGLANWATQKAWAENLNFAGSSDWVLPGIGEYFALFSAYGNLGSASLPFVDVQSNFFYWSGTEFAPIPVDAWLFSTTNGFRINIGKVLALYAVAVRPGDVAASVPEPQTLALALLALGATVVARRRRPA